MKILNRRTVGFTILALWLGVVAWHVRREYFKTSLAIMTEGAQSLSPGRYIYLVTVNGTPTGIANSGIDTIASGFLLEDRLTLDVPAMGRMSSAEAITRVELGNSLELKNFNFKLDSDVGRFEVRGTAASDSVLDIWVNSGSGEQHSQIRLNEPIVLPIAVPLQLAAAGRLEVGEEFAFKLFDPSILEAREATIRILAHDTMAVAADSAVFDSVANRWVVALYDTLPVWKIEQSLGGVSMSSWVDDDGHVVRAESALGFALERLPYEVARERWTQARDAPQTGGGYGAIIESTAIASNVELSDSAEARLAVRLLDVDLTGFDLEGGRQELRGDTLLIQRESGGQLEADYRLPYRGAGEPAEELVSTPLIQATDPDIVRRARMIADGERDPAVVARRLNQWVYLNLSKEITLSIPSATQVLEARQGDCNEHTVLYVALARALGLPARTAVGLVHVNGRFYYHAWPEVWLEEWVAMDPTLGQVPADAAHLRFLIGGLARQVDLVRLIGKLRLEVI